MPPWAKGLLFSAAFLILIFFLKVICPLEVGCLVDPFLLVVFKPLFWFENLFEISSSEEFSLAEPLLVFSFWVIVGTVLGFLFGKKER
jgi:hypothetical protein